MEFVKNLKAAKYTLKDYNKVIEKIYIQCQQDLITMQTDYDTETKNSQLAEQQELWNKKIDVKMDAFAKQWNELCCCFRQEVNPRCKSGLYG